MSIARRFTLSCLILVALVMLCGQAFADYDRVLVGTCQYDNLAHYSTIQSAINAVTYGDTVFVCPGTYPEQVVITTKLTLQGVSVGGQNAAVIVPPTNPTPGCTTSLVGNWCTTADLDNLGNLIAAQILVQGAGSVSITNLTVDGTGNGITGCSPDLRGILFQNASGTVQHVAVRNQVPGGTLGVCQSGGEGIFVQTAAGSSSAVKVIASSVHNYNTNGITGNDPGTTLTLTGNFVQGSGLVSGGAVQNGIQVGFGATGTIKGNSVIDNVSSGSPPYAAGILLHDTLESSGITVSGNTVGNSQYPIALEADNTDSPNFGDGVTVTANEVFGTSVYDAIDVCTNGNTVTKNTIFNSAESGIHLDASCGLNGGPVLPPTGNHNTVTGNIILESACAAILDDNSGGGDTNTATPDTYYTVPFQVASTSASCVLPGAGPTRAKTTHRFSPRK